MGILVWIDWLAPLPTNMGKTETKQLKPHVPDPTVWSPELLSMISDERAYAEVLQ